MVRFIDLLGYREITLKSDTELAIVGIIRTVKCNIESRTQEPLSEDSPVAPWWSTPDASCPGASKVGTGRHHLRDFMVRNRHRNSSRSERSMNRTDEQDEPLISVRGLARNAKQQCRVFHRECRRCVQSSRNPETGTSGKMGRRSN